MATYLNVPFEQKNDAKEMGARFDFERKKWFVPETVPVAPFLDRWSLAPLPNVAASGASSAPAPPRSPPPYTSFSQTSQQAVASTSLTPKSRRIYIDVRDGFEGAVRALGAHFDFEKKLFYIPPELDARSKSNILSIFEERPDSTKLAEKPPSANRYFRIHPFSPENNAIAKQHGARWDPEYQLWWVPANVDATELAARWPEVDPDTPPRFFRVPFDDNDHAKALGGVWDNDHKLWRVPVGVHVAPFSRRWKEVTMDERNGRRG